MMSMDLLSVVCFLNYNMQSYVVSLVKTPITFVLLDPSIFMNDKEKVEAIKKLLSLNISSFEEYAKYVGIIHNILDEKMTMTEVDEYIKDNF